MTGMFPTFKYYPEVTGFGGERHMAENTELPAFLVFPGLVSFGNSRTAVTLMSRCTWVVSLWWMC